MYVDGVRQNQPFGDVVSWDLIPKDAISEMTLIPGSDPLFGLNTLGGAISVTTKSGLTNPDGPDMSCTAAAGAKKWKASGAAAKRTGFNWFLSGLGIPRIGLALRFALRRPPGIRAAGLAHRQDRPRAHHVVRLQHADSATAFRITGCSPHNYSERLLDSRQHGQSLAFVQFHRAAFLQRQPDVHRQRLVPQHPHGNHQPNFNDDAQGGLIYQPTPEEQQVLAAAGYTGFPTSGADITNTPFPKWPCIAEALQLGSPDSTCDGVNIYSKEVQNEYGFSGQFTWITNPGIGRNQFAAGALIDRNNITYTQTTDYAYVLPNYTLVSVPAWQDGSTVDCERQSRRHTGRPERSLSRTGASTSPTRSRCGRR